MKVQRIPIKLFISTNSIASAARADYRAARPASLHRERRYEIQESAIAGAVCPKVVKIKSDKKLDTPSCEVWIAGLAESAGSLAGIVPTIVDFPRADITRVYGINKPGDIVGTYEMRDPAVIVHSHGFLRANGRFATIDFPGSFGTEACGINTAGQIVGVYWDNQGAARGRHGFLLSGGLFMRIDGPHAAITRALGINNRGQIVGVYAARGDLENGTKIVGPACGRRPVEVPIGSLDQPRPGQRAVRARVTTQGAKGVQSREGLRLRLRRLRCNERKQQRGYQRQRGRPHGDCVDR